jgi:hypothetical protein
MITVRCMQLLNILVECLNSRGAVEIIMAGKVNFYFCPYFVLKFVVKYADL